MFWIILSAVICIAVCMRLFLIDWMWVSGDSMLPTINEGELVLAEKVSKHVGCITPQDVVIVNYPDGNMCVKRIIAVSGDMISINRNTVYVNNQAVNEEYLYEEYMADMATIIVPDHSVFVMGDNRNHSSDSRDPAIGNIPESSIIGRVFIVIYPFDRIRCDI